MIYLVASRSRTDTTTYRHGSQITKDVSVTRWEWGHGRGKWYREQVKEAKKQGARITRKRRIWFLIGTYYRLEIKNLRS